MENRATSPKGDPPDYSKDPLHLPKALFIRFFFSQVDIGSREDDGFEWCRIPLGELLERMASSSIQVESIHIEIHDGTTEVQFEEVCKIVRTMSSLKVLELRIYRSSSVKWGKDVSKLLLDMRMLHSFVLHLEDLDESDAKLLVDALLQIQGLSIFELDLTQYRNSGELASRAMEHLCRYLRAPTCVLTGLDYEGHVSDKAVSLLASALAENKSLQSLCFFKTRVLDPSHTHPSGIGSIGDALRSNTTLKSLKIEDREIGALEMKKLVAALTPDSSGSQPNSTLTELDLRSCTVEGGNGVEHLCTLIMCSTSLLKLNVPNWVELQQGTSYPALENVEKLLTSLQPNRTLKYLSLYGNTGIGGKKVLGMIMDMLLHNRTILDIDLRGTALGDEGDAEIVYAELRKRQKDYELWQSVADMPPVSPNSARIFLCGNGEAGKTTICQKWDQDVQPQAERKDQDVQPQGKRKKRQFIINWLCWKNSQQANNSKSTRGEPSEDANQRTRGIEVHKLVWGGMNISIWDMAGQVEFHSFHDLVVPNDSATGNCCLYFIVCNPYNRPLDAIESEIHYWLKFVASNTRKSESYHPHVTILMTHLDKWRNVPFLRKRLEDIIGKLRDVFRDHLSFDEEIRFIAIDNGGAKLSDALEVKRMAEEYLTTLSTNVPKVLKATIDLQSIVAEWNAIHADQPFVDWKTFEELCEKVDELKPSVHIGEAVLRKKKVYVATTLHEGGHIMYYEDLKRVIMNPQWFCHDIMGTILFKCSDLNPNLSMICDGKISQKFLEEVFVESLDSNGFEKYFEDFLSIMMKLQICYKDTDDNFLFPSLFKSEKEINLCWPQARILEDSSRYSYIGTSLASKEPTATMLTAGFFPRLQVFLQKFAPGIARRSYKLLKDSIQFSYGCSDVYIEYKNDRIDIMSRSSGTEGYELHAQIIKAINDLRSSALLGCSGVDFEESILRPYCVQELSPYEARWNQVVSRRELKKEVTSSGDLNYQHHWEENESRGVPGGFDSAESLLPQGDWRDVLQSCSQKLDVLENALASLKLSSGASSSAAAEGACLSGDLVESEPHPPGCSSDSQHLKKFLRSEFDLLHMKLDKNHDEVKGILRGLKTDIIRKQEVLYSKVSSSMSNLMEFSIQLLQSRVPKFPIFIPDSSRKSVKQMVKRIVPGLTSGRLHFFCEHKGGFHFVGGQPGVDASYGTDQTRTFGIVMFWGLTALTMLLKVGAQLGAGMGGVVPDPVFKNFMTMLDTSGLIDMCQPSGPMLEFLPDALKKEARITSFDNQVAEDWLVDFLRSKCEPVSSLHEKLGLNRVVYNERSGSNGVVAWICDDHLERGKRDDILRPLGNSI